MKAYLGYERPTKRGDLVLLQLYGPYSEPNRIFDHILVIFDCFSKYIWLRPISLLQPEVIKSYINQFNHVMPISFMTYQSDVHRSTIGQFLNSLNIPLVPNNDNMIDITDSLADIKFYMENFIQVSGENWVRHIYVINDVLNHEFVLLKTGRLPRFEDH